MVLLPMRGKKREKESRKFSQNEDRTKQDCSYGGGVVGEKREIVPERAKQRNIALMNVENRRERESRRRE
jgi:hypothetical protein